MPLRHAFPRLTNQVRRLPRVARYAGAAGLTLAALGLRIAFAGYLPEGYPFMLMFGAIVLAAAVFRRGAGLFATGLAATLVAFVFLPPTHAFSISDPRHVVGVSVFVAIGAMSSLLIGWIQDALDAQAMALDALRTEKMHNTLLLREFRHRSRNDLGSLAAMLLLRARTAAADADPRALLREAAAHAQSLARIHTRLAVAAPSDSEGAVVDTREFIGGVIEDLRQTLTGNGLRPIALQAAAISATLSTERAVALGLVLNECVQNAAKYAFPDDAHGTIDVGFCRQGDCFVLTIEDDGVGITADLEAPKGGLGTRLLRGLAAQLRGSFTRNSRPGYPGTHCELRFPIYAPAPLHVAPH